MNIYPYRASALDQLPDPNTIHLQAVNNSAVAALHNKLNGHRYENKLSPYGENDISEMLKDPIVDRTRWPKPGPAPILAAKKTEPTESEKQIYYHNLFNNLVSKYMTMLLKGDIEPIKPYETITQNTPVCDITPMYNMEKLSRFGVIHSAASPEGVAHLRQYDWQLFIPPTNQLTVINGSQRYSYIELLNLNAKARKMHIRVSDYAGQRRKWCCRSWVECELTFGKKTENKTLPMEIRYIAASAYEDILGHTKEAKFTKEETAFWNDIFGIDEPKDPGIIEISIPPHKSRPEGLTLEATSYNVKEDVKLYQKLSGVTIKSIDRNVGNELFTRNLRVREMARYMQLISLINSQIIDNASEIEHAAKTAGSAETEDKITFTFPKPTIIRGGTP